MAENAAAQARFDNMLAMLKAGAQNDIGSLIKELDAQLSRARKEGTLAVTEVLAEKRQRLLAQASANGLGLSAN
jgi:hypothetical protein